MKENQVFPPLCIGNITRQETYQSLLNDPLLVRAFTWLEENTSKPPRDGKYKLAGDDLIMNAHTLTTRRRPDILAERGFEAHRHYADLHVCIEGSEIIEWYPTNLLTISSQYDAKDDYTLYHPPKVASSIQMIPGMFVLLFPPHAHLPGIHDQHDTIHKVVFKIKLDKITGSTE